MDLVFQRAAGKGQKENTKSHKQKDVTQCKLIYTVPSHLCYM